MNDTTKDAADFQFKLMMALTPNERVACGCEMFMAAREMIFSSIPKNLSERERTRIYYERLYGEPLPEDFF